MTYTYIDIKTWHHQQDLTTWDRGSDFTVLIYLKIKSAQRWCAYCMPVSVLSCVLASLWFRLKCQCAMWKVLLVVFLASACFYFTEHFISYISRFMGVMMLNSFFFQTVVETSEMSWSRSMTSAISVVFAVVELYYIILLFSLGQT